MWDLKIDAVRSSETPMNFYPTTRHHISKCSTLCNNIREIPDSKKDKMWDLKVDAIRSSETSMNFYPTTRRHISKCSTLCNNICEIPDSKKDKMWDLKIDAIRSSETSMNFYRTTRRHISKCSTLCNNICEIPDSNKDKMCLSTPDPCLHLKFGCIFLSELRCTFRMLLRSLCCLCVRVRLSPLKCYGSRGYPKHCTSQYSNISKEPR
jgi:hypothetical protein